MLVKPQLGSNMMDFLVGGEGGRGGGGMYLGGEGVLARVLTKNYSMTIRDSFEFLQPASNVYMGVGFKMSLVCTQGTFSKLLTKD